MWSGKIYLTKKHYDSALKEFSSVGEKSGEFPAALYYKGESLRIKGNTVAAIENYQIIVSSSFPEMNLLINSILITVKLYLNSGKGYQSL
jgi:predicted negative regulator of RcsB-dependent stress response